MTDEQINRAITEACGWTEKPKRMPDGLWYYGRFPDYCSDLNAMHEAEKVLTDEQRDLYYLRHLGAWINPVVSIYATARQRAEAFLRTIGKWEEALK